MWRICFKIWPTLTEISQNQEYPHFQLFKIFAHEWVVPKTLITGYVLYWNASLEVQQHCLFVCYMTSVRQVSCSYWVSCVSCAFYTICVCCVSCIDYVVVKREAHQKKYVIVSMVPQLYGFKTRKTRKLYALWL